MENEVKNIVTDERIDRYLDITARALAKIKIAAPERSFNRRLADSFMEMAQAYYSDAKHFRETGDLVTLDVGTGAVYAGKINVK